jgi:prepilin-type N-terminal cleavage/methylation domain-containing protein
MKYLNRGFSIIEILVSIAVMSTGLLAVATLQTDLINGSGVNKARSEALSLAEARIEDFRNYTLDITSAADFETQYAATNGQVTDTVLDVDGNSTMVIQGNNANFTRKYTITDEASGAKSINVVVEWTDRKGESQNVSLNTQLSWESPRTTGDFAASTAAPLVPSATGRAHLGEGQLPDGASTTPNGDGTELYQDGTELKLAVGDDIVLTLEDACQSEGDCISFVKIHGRVYIDSASTSVSPGDVYIKASDAAYCHRFYTDTNNVTHDVTSSTTSTLLTSNSDYKYFDYTCYLGGGWHGNIGVLFDGGIAQTDKICLGDPTASLPVDQPVIAARRVYRGMLYKIDNNNVSGKEEIPGTNHLVRYYTVGIGDGVELPVPNSGQATHDFVISRMATSDTTGDKCITATNGNPGPMMRTDANVNGTDGDLFAGVPTDFVCLNPSYVDTYNTSVYGIENTCPYDPSDPPTLHYTIAGALSVDGDSSMSAAVNGMNIVTSDGSGNCSMSSFTFISDTYTATYSCDIFDWGNGWTGFVQVQPNSDSISCTNHTTNFSAVNQDLTGYDFACSGGDFVIFRGTVSISNANRTLDSATISDAGGVCTVTSNSYECRTSTLQAATWTGSITLTATNGVVCHSGVTAAQSITLDYTDVNPGIITDTMAISNNANTCP